MKRKLSRKVRALMNEKEATKDPGLELELLKEKVDVKNDVVLSISGDETGQAIHVTLRAAKAADVIEKMATANWPKANVDKCFAEILCPLKVPEFPPEELAKPEVKKKFDEMTATAKSNFCTRPAIAKISANFAPAGEWDWEGKPSALLLHNPEALRNGFTIIKKIEKPVPPDLLSRWGKQIIDGVSDILKNARPFRMTWTMKETPAKE